MRHPSATRRLGQRIKDGRECDGRSGLSLGLVYPTSMGCADLEVLSAPGDPP